MAVEWKEMPSVSPGGKRSFFVTFTPQGKRSVVWDRLEQKWAVMGEQMAPRGESPVYGLFASSKEAKKFVEGRGGRKEPVTSKRKQKAVCRKSSMQKTK